MLEISIIIILLGLIMVDDPNEKELEKDYRNFQKIMQGKSIFKPNFEDIKDKLKEIFSIVFVVAGLILLCIALHTGGNAY